MKTKILATLGVIALVSSELFAQGGAAARQPARAGHGSTGARAVQAPATRGAAVRSATSAASRYQAGVGSSTIVRSQSAAGVAASSPASEEEVSARGQSAGLDVGALTQHDGVRNLDAAAKSLIASATNVVPAHATALRSLTSEAGQQWTSTTAVGNLTTVLTTGAESNSTKVSDGEETTIAGGFTEGLRTVGIPADKVGACPAANTILSVN